MAQDSYWEHQELHLESELGTRLQLAMNTRFGLLQEISKQRIYKMQEAFS